MSELASDGSSLDGLCKRLMPSTRSPNLVEGLFMTSQLRRRLGGAAIVSLLGVVGALVVASVGGASNKPSPYASVKTCASVSPCLSYKNTKSGNALAGTSVGGTGINGTTDFKATSASNQAYGVLGTDASGSAFDSGIAGSSTNGNGVYGNSSAGSGVFGFSSSTYGVVASSALGGGLFAQGTPSLVLEPEPNSTQDMLDSYDKNSNLTARLDSAGNLHLSGKVYTSGSCSTGCAVTLTSSGRSVTAYHPRAAEPIMEDYGQARLVNGRADVRIDQSFAQTLDGQAKYLVFLTPKADNRGLYVTEETRAGFVVRESQHGNATLDFDYHIVAKPFDTNGSRLSPAVTPPLGRGPAKQPPSTARR
jgi:hypothetical protein